jgi:hypothetical protein
MFGNTTEPSARPATQEHQSVCPFLASARTTSQMSATPPILTDNPGCLGQMSWLEGRYPVTKLVPHYGELSTLRGRRSGAGGK